MSEDFKKGYRYVVDHVARGAAGDALAAWNKANSHLLESTVLKSELIKDLKYEIGQETFKRQNLGAEQLQGFVAEIFHTQTYNTDIHLNKSNIAFAERPNVNTLGSGDVITTEKAYNLKSYKSASATIDAITETPMDRYQSLRNKAERHGKTYKSADEFLEKRNIDEDSVYKSIYHGQGIVVAADKLKDVQKGIEQRIRVLQMNQDAQSKLQIENLMEVRANLSDVIRDNAGNESIPLSHEHATKLAYAAKNGEIDKKLLNECGLDKIDEINAQAIAASALKAGLSAATLSLMISIAPTIVNGISMLISEGEIDAEALKEGGIEALPTAAKSFLSGSVTAAFNACCQTGKFGAELLDADPMILSAMVVVTINTVGVGMKFASGRIDKAEMAREIMQMYVTTAFSTGGGYLLTALCEGFPFAYMMGSFIGGIIGGLVYSAGEKLFLSFCIDSGCTFFGLVDQNYTLPERVIEELGLEQFLFDQLEIDAFQYDVFETENFSIDSFSYAKFGIEILRRDLIGVSAIGYT